MKHAVIFSHPKEQSFTASVARTFSQAAAQLGHSVICRDLYRLSFQPCLEQDELPGGQFAAAADVLAERKLLADVDVFAFVYPLWLNAPPAMMKGYLERVFGLGFAYGGPGRSANPLLTGRKLIVFSSSGAPLEWVKESGAFEALRTLFDGYFAKLCGLTVLDHVHFGNIVPGATEDFVQARLEDVKKSVTAYFADQPIKEAI